MGLNSSPFSSQVNAVAIDSATYLYVYDRVSGSCCLIDKTQFDSFQLIGCLDYSEGKAIVVFSCFTTDNTILVYLIDFAAGTAECVCGVVGSLLVPSFFLELHDTDLLIFCDCSVLVVDLTSGSFQFFSLQTTNFIFPLLFSLETQTLWYCLESDIGATLNVLATQGGSGFCKHKDGGCLFVFDDSGVLRLGFVNLGGDLFGFEPVSFPGTDNLLALCFSNGKFGYYHLAFDPATGYPSANETGIVNGTIAQAIASGYFSKRGTVQVSSTQLQLTTLTTYTLVAASFGALPGTTSTIQLEATWKTL